MASHEAYLRSALSKYSYAEQTKREALNVLKQFTDLRPTIQKYVFNDGISKDLLCLEGTIQVTYKDFPPLSSRNVISNRAFQEAAPQLWKSLPKDMRRPHPDTPTMPALSFGKTYNIPICMWLMDTHPYNPPLVYVKPTPNMQIKTGKHVDQAGRIYLPYLHEWKHPQSDIMGLLQIMAIVFGDEPPVFAKPGSSGGAASTTPYPTGGAMPYPAAGGPSMPMPGAYQPPNPSYMPYPQAAGSQPYPGYPPYPAAQPNAQARPPYPGYGGANPPYPGYGGQPPYPPVTTTTPVHAVNNQQLSDEQIKLSLLSAVEDKMKRRLREIMAQSQAEIDTLKKTEEDLQRGRQKLDDMLQKLEREQNEVERNIRVLQEKDEEMKEALSKMENKDEVSVDDAVQPTAPLYKQLLNAFAEEQAIEDAIYYLGEALRKGVIELDVFLKQVRELSRKQFMLRMLIHKCRQKAGLPDISG